MIRSAAALILLAALPASAAERYPGPYRADVLAVVDGDTVRARVQVWPGQVAEGLIRIDGIDTPELRARCESERQRARQAREYLREMLRGRPLVFDVRADKYGGRYIGRIVTAQGIDVAQGLIAAGLARPYAGGKRAPWC